MDPLNEGEVPKENAAPNAPAAETPAPAAPEAAPTGTPVSQGATPKKEEKRGWLGGHTVGRDDAGPNGALRKSGLSK